MEDAEFQKLMADCRSKRRKRNMNYYEDDGDAEVHLEENVFSLLPVLVNSINEKPNRRRSFVLIDENISLLEDFRRANFSKATAKLSSVSANTVA